MSLSPRPPSHPPCWTAESVTARVTRRSAQKAKGFEIITSATWQSGPVRRVMYADLYQDVAGPAHRRQTARRDKETTWVAVKTSYNDSDVAQLTFVAASVVTVFLVMGGHRRASGDLRIRKCSLAPNCQFWQSFTSPNDS